MHEDLRESLKRRVGGTLANVNPLRRLEVLRANARLLRPEPWQVIAKSPDQTEEFVKFTAEAFGKSSS